jgi:hypothetical protein
MLLTLLPDELSVPCAEQAGPGVVIVVRPLDLEDKARWYTACLAEGLDVGSPPASVRAVKLQLVRVEGVTVVYDAGTPAERRVAFDAADPQHFRVLPMAAVLHAFGVMYDRSTLTETQRGN